MRVIRDIDELASVHDGAFVPTMGALHKGHLALIRRAVETPHRPVVVSVFVNPTQFAEGDDFERYPRTLDDDVARAEEAGADIVFAPDADSVYPPGQPVEIPPLPAVATGPGLEDAFRPGHFEGVCQVVARLFDLVRPRAAVFGEKDYQQLRVIMTIVAQQQPRWGDLEIIPHETIREEDGLALSSRHAYFWPGDRDRAVGLYSALQVARGAPTPDEAETAMDMILFTHGLKVDYAVVRDAETLMPVKTLGRPTRALIAAKVRSVRLIDNTAMPVA